MFSVCVEHGGSYNCISLSNPVLFMIIQLNLEPQNSGYIMAPIQQEDSARNFLFYCVFWTLSFKFVDIFPTAALQSDRVNNI